VSLADGSKSSGKGNWANKRECRDDEIVRRNVSGKDRGEGGYIAYYPHKMQ